MTDLNFSNNQKIAHRMGNSAINTPSVRYITKDALKSELSAEKFKEYESLFDYIDKYDNSLFETDGKIDLATFGDMDYIKENKDGANVYFIGEIFNSNSLAQKLGSLLNVSKEKLQSFFDILLNFQLKRDSYLNNGLNNNDIQDKVVNTEIKNNIDGTETVINYYSNNDREEITRNKTQILNKILYDQNDKIMQKEEYKYENNKISEKIFYDANTESTEKSKFLYFKTEDDANKYCESIENNPPENIVGYGITKENDEYIVDITYSSEN